MPTLESVGTLPCEIDQAKPDRISRLARSTNLSKILASIRLSGLVGSRPRQLRRGVLELVEHNKLCNSMHTSPFLREPFKHIELQPPSQAQPLLFARGRSNTLWAVHPRLRIRVDWMGAWPGKLPFKSVAQRKISNNDRQTAPKAAKAHRSLLLGLAKLVL